MCPEDPLCTKAIQKVLGTDIPKTFSGISPVQVGETKQCWLTNSHEDDGHLYTEVT